MPTKNEQTLLTASVRAHSLSHMQEVFSTRYCPYTVTQENRSDPLDARYSCRSFASSSINYVQFGARVRIQPAEFDSFYLVHIPLTGHAALNVDGKDMIIGPGTATVVSPSARFFTRWSADCGQVMLRLSRHRVESVLSELITQPIRDPVQFEALREGAGSATSFFGFVDYLAQSLAGDDGISPAFISEQLEQTAIKLLLAGADHSYSEAVRTRHSASPRHVARAYNFMVKMSHEQVTVEDLIQVAGVSKRALYDGFKLFKNMSPMACLRAIRLRKVRIALSEASEASSVAMIAHACGFQHLGRFAQSYYEVYGEHPSQTLRRS